MIVTYDRQNIFKIQVTGAKDLTLQAKWARLFALGKCFQDSVWKCREHKLV